MMGRRTFLKMTAAGAALSGTGISAGCAFLHGAPFGAAADNLQAFPLSPHCRDGLFRNTLPTPMFSDGSSFAGALVRSLFARKDRPEPPAPVPAVRADLAGLSESLDLFLWLGHSSFYLQAGGARFLIDPVFSPYAAPVSFSTRAFAGTTPYQASDMPAIDFLLISHDHWDHLDYPTVMALREKTGHVVCPLGVGAHFRRWGFEESRIHEGDWEDTLAFGSGISVTVTESRHFSGRSLSQNRTLWGGFLIRAGGRKIFYSGDGGYGPHFKALGRACGVVDLAFLDSGQYNTSWRYVHMTPEEAVQAALDLGARAYLPAHAGKFALARHPWDDPFRRTVSASQGKNFHLLTPRIGEPVALGSELPVFPFWWEELAETQGDGTKA